MSDISLVTPQVHEPHDVDLDWGSFASEPDLVTYVYRLSADGHAQRVAGSRHAYVCRIDGTIDPEILRQHVGGGRYRLLIRRGSGDIIRKLTVEIAGVPRGEDALAAASPAVPTPAAVVGKVSHADVDPAELAQRIAASVAGALAPVLERLAPRDAISTRELIELMRGAPAAAPAAIDAQALFRTQVEALNRGMDLARSVQGGRTVGDALVESMPQIFETVDKLIATRATAVVPPQPGIAAAAPAAAAATDPLLPLAGLVAQALERGTDSRTLADVIDALYGEQEIARLARVTPAMACASLRRFCRVYPVLAGPGLEALVQPLLADLAAPGGGDDEPEASSPDAQPQTS